MSAVKSVPTYRQILKLTKKYKVASLLFYTSTHENSSISRACNTKLATHFEGFRIRWWVNFIWAFHFQNADVSKISMGLLYYRFGGGQEGGGGRRAPVVRKQDSYARAIESGCPPPPQPSNNNSAVGMGRWVVVAKKRLHSTGMLTFAVVSVHFFSLYTGLWKTPSLATELDTPVIPKKELLGITWVSNFLIALWEQTRVREYPEEP